MQKNNNVILFLLVILMIIIAAAAVFYPKLAEIYNQENTASTQTGEKAADFTVLDMDGNEVRLSDYFGKPIIVNFWATWCGPCQSEMPDFDQVYAQYQDQVTFLMVNYTDGAQDTVEGVKEFIAQTGYSFPVYLDTEQNAINAYGINAFPTTIFIDKEGNIFGSQLGAMNQDLLTDYVEDLLK